MITTPTHPQADSYVTVDEADAMMQERLDYGEAWEALDDDKKERLLKIATANIDTLRFFEQEFYPRSMEYRGKQALKFPRFESSRFATGKADSVTTTTLTDADRADRSDEPDDYWNDGALIIYDGAGKGKTYKITDFDMATGMFTVEGTFSPAIDTTSYYKAIEKIPQEIKYAVMEQALYIMNGGGERARLQAEGVASYSIGDLSETFNGKGANGIALSQETKGYLRGYISIIGTIE